MRRSLYRVVIALHPPRFRERFGEEMMCVLDEAGPESTARIFADGFLSLLRQWLLRSDLWKTAMGMAISALVFCTLGDSMLRGLNASRMRESLSRERLAMNASFGERPRPFDEAGFSLEAVQAVEILAEIRKAEARKHHRHPHDSLRSTPSYSRSAHANQG